MKAEEQEGSEGFPFIIRRAREEDIDQVMEVNLASLPENYWYSFYVYVLNEWGDAFLVAEHQGKIIGYIMNRVEETHDKVLMGLENELTERPGKSEGLLDAIRRRFSESAKVGHVISIAVLAEYRRKGVGSALMQEAINVLKSKYDVDAIYLEVRVSNTPAINLYEKFGFEKVRIIKGYYRDGEDAYVMVKRLKPVQ
ncbi:N-terminal acetyltransferase [Acidilobus saccharovorans 345-15]|uniref:N-terminal acetyltransferase n=1 Tax=Acidilobus saccharovorans (strain DSM 16705 / JCM 18335 / VKM B-2471 / 345-15) TaxID=666510 RepID=D9Q045_ACIS3|nr:ribosomal protein S18-alanine N-acetyltransferase [Acidilobus saccharovorans]ADL18683.1 N-terminal acetyltransferase [Acidilobus saccharovorans 345-15]